MPKPLTASEPEIDMALVDWLDRLNPPKEAEPGVPHADLIFHSGKRALVAFLRLRAEIQLRNAEQNKT